MNSRRDPQQEVKDAATSGMFAMMAMMAICCVAIFLLLAVIPVIGWPAGAVLAVGLGTALMYAHMKFMGHGSRH